MDYLDSLQCKTEPFASSSGVEIVVSQAVRDSIAKLSHYIRLGTGLQLVIGTAGAGKTTLLHHLAQKFSADDKTVVLLLSNPQFRDLQQFLITVTGIFKTIKAPSCFDDDIFQKAFNNLFYKLCKQEKKTVLLLIDNGQDLPDFCLHALNSFYDHHPDCSRFLQTVICGEPSFQRKINGNKALNSRAVFVTTPKPFSFKDVRKLIRVHLDWAAADPGSPPVLFSIPAQCAIFCLAQGHPQKTIDLCHFIVLTLVIENRKKAGWFMALRSAKPLFPPRAKRLQIIRTTFLSSLIVLMLVFGFWPVKVLQETSPPNQNRAAPQTESAVIEKTLPPVMPAEEEITGMVGAEKSAAVLHQPEDKASTTEVPEPESSEIEEEKPFVAATAPESQPGKDFVLEQQPVDSPDLTGKRVKPPEYLGDIITAPGENFGDMIRRIYGPWSFNTENVKTVIAANPDLKNPELLNVGDTIRFPTIPVALTPEAEEVWWVRINTLDNIQSAYRFLRQYRKSSPPLLILPSRDDSGQVLMNILLEEYFTDKESAQKAIHTLPGAITAQAAALHGLDPATFYYELKRNEQKKDETQKR
jgi:general secretion pathway protein A